jgi:hypothetical protein
MKITQHDNGPVMIVCEKNIEYELIRTGIKQFYGEAIVGDVKWMTHQVMQQLCDLVATMDEYYFIDLRKIGEKENELVQD